MKKFIFIVPLVALSTFSCANKSIDPKKIDLYKTSYDYKNDKETLSITTTYEYNKNNLLEKSFATRYDTDATSLCQYTYDSHENVATYREEDNYHGDITTVKYEETNTTYDDKDRPILVDVSYYLDENFQKRNCKIYEYSEQQTIISEYKYNKTIEEFDELISTTTLIYNDKNQLINEEAINQDPYHSYIKEYTYDEYGCCDTTKEYEVAEEGGKGGLKTSTTSTYHKNLYYRPKEVITTRYELGNAATITYIYNYDKRDRIISRERIASDDNAPKIARYTTYEY